MIEPNSDVVGDEGVAGEDASWVRVAACALCTLLLSQVVGLRGQQVCAGFELRGGQSVIQLACACFAKAIPLHALHDLTMLNRGS